VITETLNLLSRSRFNLSTEALLKQEMKKLMDAAGLVFDVEYTLDKHNRLDFYKSGIAIEVKIKGSAKSIYKQIERYSTFEQVKTLVLVTNKPMGFPKTINGKDCFVINLGKAWL
jgi:hypothetical protein